MIPSGGSEVFRELTIEAETDSLPGSKLFLSVGTIYWVFFPHLNNGVPETRRFQVFRVNSNCGIRPSYYPGKTTKRRKSSNVHRGDSEPSLLDELKEDIDDAEDNRYNVRKYLKALQVGCHVPPFVFRLTGGKTPGEFSTDF